uniref:MCM3 minichromosome maintenance deficient 3 (S. cerevisiae), like isoform X2 n=1 Tax=Oncorhynchus gorbuscha TaxID=8017 RepID=UPI001EAF88C2|nr:MCM3 minichromosome maintenance deficient 3 (S. cerevisiae), like isoform X2 [Oncorhynchus gorbuscha]
MEDLELREAQREYLDFLDDNQDQGVYHERVRSMVSENRCRLIVNINDLRRRNEKRAKALLKDSFNELVAFQGALKDFVASIDATYAKQFEEFHVGFEGSFGTKHVTPRTLAARYLGNLVCVEGIVTKCSLVRPKITRSVHYCPATKKTLERKYTDLTSLDAFPSSSIYPTKDEENNPLETEFGLCVYKDHQTLTIQEMPEKAPAGQLPRSVDIIANDDLVDKVKPGDRVQMVGIYRCLPAKQGGFTSGTFRTILLANHVKWMSKEIVPTFSAEDINKIKKFCKAHSKDVFEHLSCSLAPSIHGHEYIKKAILCLLLGGNETNLENGTRIRGDINILLIGDPSTAKSQLLRYVLHTAPRAIPTTGRGSTGVGLTAAVTTDQETGERRLEAGAMVLADRGVVCIDEFDKMSDMDRTAIHEYDQYKTPMENIGLQDSLLSRFDLLFIVLDQMDADSDRKVSEHVLRMHRYRAPGEQEGTAMPMGSTVDVFATEDPNITESAEQELQIYEKKDNVLHGHRNKKEKVVTMEFIRKYIHVAKLVKPVLTQEASNHIAEEYSKLRSHDQVNAESARTMPVTARALETMIRLSTAHAKARMSKTTDLVDAEAALELMQFAYFKKILEKRRKVVEDDMGVTQSQEVASQRTSTRKRKEIMDVTDAGAESDPYEFEDEEHAQSILKHKNTTSQSLRTGQDIRQDRLKLFKVALMKAFQTTRSQSVAVTELLTLVNKTTHGQDNHEFDEQEVEKLLGRMQADNQIMMSEGVVFLI